MAGQADDWDYHVAVILDSENVTFTSLMGDFVRNTETSLRHVDDRYKISHVRVYSGHEDTYFRTQHLRLQEQLFKYVPTRKRKRKCDMCSYVKDRGEPPSHEFERTFDIADSILIEEMLGCGLLDTLPPNLLLITTDRDFIPSLYYLSEKNYNIFAAKNKNSDNSLNPTPYASATWYWKDLQLGLPPTHRRQTRIPTILGIRHDTLSLSNDVALFWDINSLEPTNLQVQDMLNSILTRIQSVNADLRLHLRERYAVEDKYLLTNEQKRVLKENDFNIHHAPERMYRCDTCIKQYGSEVKGDAPEIVIRSLMLGRALTGFLPRTILLMTGDCDFSRALKYLKTKGFHVYLVKSERSASFGEVVTHPPWNWEDL